MLNMGWKSRRVKLIGIPRSANEQGVLRPRNSGTGPLAVEALRGGVSYITPKSVKMLGLSGGVSNFSVGRLGLHELGGARRAL